MFSTVTALYNIKRHLYIHGREEGDSLSLSLSQRDNRQAGQVDPAHSLNYQSTGMFAAPDAFPAHLVQRLPSVCRH